MGNITLKTVAKVISHMVDVTGIDRMELLKALWDRSDYSVFFKPPFFPIRPFDEQKARNDCMSYNGCPIICYKNIGVNPLGGGDNLDPTGFDSWNGDGAFKEVVESLKTREKEREGEDGVPKKGWRRVRDSEMKSIKDYGSIWNDWNSEDI